MKKALRLISFVILSVAVAFPSLTYAYEDIRRAVNEPRQMPGYQTPNLMPQAVAPQQGYIPTMPQQQFYPASQTMQPQFGNNFPAQTPQQQTLINYNDPYDVANKVAQLLMQNPANTSEIVQSYLQIDPSKIDIKKLSQMAQSRDTMLVSDVLNLYSNRDNINQDTMVNKKFQENPSGEESSNNLYYYGGGALAAGVAALAMGGGGGGGSGSSNDNPDFAGDIFDRTALEIQASESSFETVEFNAYPLDALNKSNAQYAYARGLSGEGVVVGIWDDFEDNSELITDYADNVVSPTADVAVFGTPTCDRNTDALPNGLCHGEEVARRLAASRVVGDYQGMAYKAKLVLANATPIDVGLTPLFESLIDTDFLVDVGTNQFKKVSVVNTSCGDCLTLADLQYAKDNDVLVTAATGNTGGPNPVSPANLADQLDFHLIAVSAIDANGQMTYAERCGSQRNYCMVAYSEDGTSFASPQVAGAAALIREGWSFLTAKETAQILLSSATDLGATGVDAIYGRGLLNVEAAMKPIGTPIVLVTFGLSNFSTSTISQNQGNAFGNAFSNPANSNGNINIIDDYGRDFAVKPQDNLFVYKNPTISPEKFDMFGSDNTEQKTVKLNNSLSLTFKNTDNGSAGSEITSFTENQITDSSRAKFGFSTDVNDLFDSSEIQKFNKSSFVTSGVFDNSFLNFSDNNQVFLSAVEFEVDNGITTKFTNIYSQDKYIENLAQPDMEVTSAFATSMFETIVSPTNFISINFKNGFTHEFESLLGSRFSGAFDIANGANTYFTGIDASFDIADNWNLFASYNIGLTKTEAALNSAFTNVSDIVSDSFAVTLSRKEVFGEDSLSFSVAQPLRVISGNASGFTQSVDNQTGAVSITGFSQSLEPTATNYLMQTAYEKKLSKKAKINFATEYSVNPDNRQDLPDEKSFMGKIKYKLN